MDLLLPEAYFTVALNCRRNQFTGSNFPIRNKTVVTLDKNTGDVLHSWGDSMFYLPHMLTVDKQNNVWVTDVGLHQVFKFSAPTYDRPVLTLGTKVCHFRALVVITILMFLTCSLSPAVMTLIFVNRLRWP